MKITVTGQLGNWLFHTASAIKHFGNIKQIISLGCSASEFVNAKNIFGQICHISPVKGSCTNMINVVKWHIKSNWQSLAEIPSREECRKFFNVPKITPETSPVIHVRGGDYLTYFNKPSEKITLSRTAIEKIVEKFGCTAEECIVVTDDVNYVKSLGLNFKQIRCSTAFNDFTYMCNAKRLAISPSTFSWWAGFLGDHEEVLFPIGTGPWDNGILDKDKHSAHNNLDLCWGEECKPVYIGEENVFALMCTGRYKELFPGFYETFRKYHSEKLYVFTDNEDYFKNYNVETLKINHEQWPGICMHKYSNLLKYKHLLCKHKNIVFLQANMRFTRMCNYFDYCGDLMFTYHPYNKNKKDYICGGLVGGNTYKFFKMAAIVDKWLQENSNAQWHDETALNWYYNNFKPACKVLPSWTMVAEEKPEYSTGETSIMLLDKAKFFGTTRNNYAK